METIIPQPVLVRVVESAPFTLSEMVRIRGEGGAAKQADQFATALHELTGVNTDSTGAGTGQVPEVSFALLPRDGRVSLGAYRLTAREHRIAVEADSAEGLFYASQTVLQLLRLGVGDRWFVPAGDIEDSPRFRWRGLLVDVAAHFQSKETIKGIIDQVAYFKLNVLHLHLTDNGGWRVEIPHYPKLTLVGARGNEENPNAGPPLFYTAADIREIVEYAGRKFIRVVPEVDFPGHSAAAARAYPEYFDGDRTINPAAPGVFEFITAVVGEVARLFPDSCLHIGGDEIVNDRWSEYPEISAWMRKEGLSNKKEVQAYCYRRVADIIAKAGRRPVFWDEAAEAGLGKEVVVQWWRKYHPEVRDRALAEGHEVVLSPSDQVYLDYQAGHGEPGAPWEGNDNGPTSLAKILAWEPIPETMPPDSAARVLGVEAALWTGFIRTEGFLQFMLYPRLAAVAEVAWTPSGQTNPANFERRLVPHLARFRSMEINARTKPEDAWRYMRH